MSQLPVPQFHVGQTVYAATRRQDYVTSPCPDCNGTREWTAKTAIGEEFPIPCGSCTEGWYSTGVQKKSVYVPEVRRLTIGSIRMDTGDQEKPVSYMCRETGIGSGAIWYEEGLSSSEEAALVIATRLAASSQAEHEKRQAAIEEVNRKKTHKKPTYEQKEIKRLLATVKKLEGELAQIGGKTT